MTVEELRAAGRDRARPAIRRRRRRCWPRTRRSTSSPRAPPGMPEGQRDDALPVAAGAGRVRRPGHAAEQQRHPVLLPAAVPQQRADGRAVVGAQLGRDAGAGQVVLGVEVLGRGDPATTPPRSSTSARSAATCSTSRPRTTDREHKVRVIAGNGLRPEIWDEFTERFGIERVCEFYARQRGQHRVRQHLQRAQDHRHLPDAGGVRRIRRRHRRPGARRQRPGPQGARPASRVCC